MGSPESQPNYADFDMEVFARNQFEATHAWPDCPIEEVAFLRNEHRHVFHIESYKEVNHDDREQEFIVMKHRIQEWLEEQYPEGKLGSTSCEMLAIRLIGEFGLSRCMVSEDGENGAWVTPRHQELLEEFVEAREDEERRRGAPMIWYVPLEYIDRRYTKAMDQVIREELDEQGKQYQVIGNPDQEQVIPNKKDFLNSTGTNITRFGQLAEVAKLFAEGKVEDGDVFFFSDLWAAGIEAIPYMAYFNDKKVRVTGILHAGSFTPSDFVANLSHWAKDYERAVIKMSDKVFLGSSQPLMDLIEGGYIDEYGKMVITGIPISTEKMYELAKPKPWEEKEDIAVFAGRLVDEKQPHLFDRLRDEFPEYRFVKTLDENLSKQEYLELMSRAKVFISFAKQENYGIAAVEAAAYGVNLIVPDELSYKDFYPAKYRYNPDPQHRDVQVKEMIRRFMEEDNTEELMELADGHNQNVRKLVNEL